MKSSRALQALAALLVLTGWGCTSLREIPPGSYASSFNGSLKSKPVRVFTRDSLEYDLDSASLEADTLVGYRRRDVEGPVEEFDTIRLPLDRVATISARSIDWTRTGIVGGVTLVAIVASALAIHNQQTPPTESSGGGPPPCKFCNQHP